MAEHNTLDADNTLLAIEALVQDGLRSPHTEPEVALENMAVSLSALVSAARTGIARMRAAHNMRASGAARLSQEAITAIVLLLDKFEDRLAACQVCRLWRTVALDIPSPWPTVSFGGYASSIAGDGPLKHVEPEYGHCSGDIEEPLRDFKSDLQRLYLLCAIPGSAGLSLRLELEAHCEDPFTNRSDIPPEEVLERALQSLQALAAPITRDTLASAFSVKDKLFLDALHPLVMLADRISSLTLSFECENWLNIFLCVPPMSMLCSLTITSRGEDMPSLPHALLRVLGFPLIDELPIVFPALQYLKVCDIQWAASKGPVSSSLIASLLRSVPQLRSLDVHFVSWPRIDMSKQSSTLAGLQSRGAAQLKSIVLGSGGHSWLGNRAFPSFDALLNVLPITDGGSIEYRAARCASYEGVFSVLARADFLPTALSVIFSPEISWKSASLDVEATDAAGGKRVAHAEGSCAWSGDLIGEHLSATHLTSLTLNMAAWDGLADGFSAHAVERLEIVFHPSDVTINERVNFAPNTPPARHMHLPALTTLSFGIHSSLWDELERYEIAGSYIRVPVSVLAADIRAVSPPSGRIEKLVIGKGITPVATAEDPDEDSFAELRNMSNSMEIL